MRRHFVRFAWLCLGLVLACGFNPAVDGPPAGNPDGQCPVSGELLLDDTSTPDHVVGSGTPESCTGQAFLEAVRQGGIVTFDCGPEPIAIRVGFRAELFMEAGSKIVIDGGGKVALSGGSYQALSLDPCLSRKGYRVLDCDSLPTPQLTVQNLTFYDSGVLAHNSGGGGAISVVDGRLKVVNCRFFNNSCELENNSEGCGGAIYVASYFKDASAVIVNSTFGGQTGLGNVGTNGGVLAGADASFFIVNTVFSDNIADADFPRGVGSGVLGDGNGGAIFAAGYNKEVSVNLCGVRMNHNRATGVGGAIYFGGHQAGSLEIRNSALFDNVSRVETGRYPGIFATEKTLIRVTQQ